MRLYLRIYEYFVCYIRIYVIYMVMMALEIGANPNGFCEVIDNIVSLFFVTLQLDYYGRCAICKSKNIKMTKIISE